MGRPKQPDINKSSATRAMGRREQFEFKKLSKTHGQTEDTKSRLSKAEEWLPLVQYVLHQPMPHIPRSLHKVEVCLLLLLISHMVKASPALSQERASDSSSLCVMPRSHNEVLQAMPYSIQVCKEYPKMAMPEVKVSPAVKRAQQFLQHKVDTVSEIFLEYAVKYPNVAGDLKILVRALSALSHLNIYESYGKGTESEALTFQQIKMIAEQHPTAPILMVRKMIPAAKTSENILHHFAVVLPSERAFLAHPFQGGEGHSARRWFTGVLSEGGEICDLSTGTAYKVPPKTKLQSDPCQPNMKKSQCQYFYPPSDYNISDYTQLQVVRVDPGYLRERLTGVLQDPELLLNPGDRGNLATLMGSTFGLFCWGNEELARNNAYCGVFLDSMKEHLGVAKPQMPYVEF